MDTTTLRTRLEERLAKLGAHNRKIEERLRQPGHPDWQEQATQRQNDEVLEALDTNELTEIKNLRSAIARIDEGNFGICSKCESKIAARRLEALPWTTLCVECAD